MQAESAPEKSRTCGDDVNRHLLHSDMSKTRQKIIQQTDLTLVLGTKICPPSEPWAAYCDTSQVRKDSPNPVPGAMMAVRPCVTGSPWWIVITLSRVTQGPLVRSTLTAHAYALNFDAAALSGDGIGAGTVAVAIWSCALGSVAVRTFCLQIAGAIATSIK